MSGTRGGVARMVAMGIALAVALLLAIAAEARAGTYSVAQCGWYAGADADWWDSTGGAKFRPDAYCVPPAGSDPSDGVHLKSFTRDGQETVSGTRFARWRWSAPDGTGIVAVSGNWWHALHDGMEQRLGGVNWGGGFEPVFAANGTDVTQRGFAASFSPAASAFEDRLLCARGEDKSCSLAATSWSGLQGLTITLEDGWTPSAWLGGELLAGGWRHGVEAISFSGGDERGAGIRFGETFLDGARIDLVEYPCEKASIGGAWLATRMQPCLTGVSAASAIDTRRFSDGNHNIHHCVTDFAGNVGCSPDQTVGIDNNAPASPRNLTVAGGEGWRRVNDFDVAWANPPQGAASPIWGAYWRITGPAGYDTGVQLLPGRDISALADRFVTRPGAYALHLWLRDEAGNDAPGSAVAVPLRFDDVPPGVAFRPDEGGGEPGRIEANVSDEHSGPAGGTISLRRLGGEGWTELPTRLQVGPTAGAATLIAALPDLAAGTYVFRAGAADAAGNAATSTRRADGTEMVIRIRPPQLAPGRSAPGRAAPSRSPKLRTRLFARLRGGHGHGDSLTVPFGDDAVLSGRLTRADGAGLAGRELRVAARPSRGALTPAGAKAVTTGERGGFQLRLEPGPSRRIVVAFAGDAGLAPSRRTPLELRVRSGISLEAAPLSLRTGQSLHLSGRVADREAPLPRRGKLVAIQYLEEATGRWRPALVTRSDHDGRFRARYRFRYVSGTASIRLRATALAEERWPYAPGSSAPLTVTVSGR